MTDYLTREPYSEDPETNAAWQARLQELEAAGHRIVSGGQGLHGGGNDTWAIEDWRTGETLAEGSDGMAGYDAAVKTLDPEGNWRDVDSIGDDLQDLD